MCSRPPSHFSSGIKVGKVGRKIELSCDTSFNPIKRGSNKAREVYSPRKLTKKKLANENFNVSTCGILAIGSSKLKGDKR